MKFINAIKLLPLTSIASSDAISAPVLSPASKSASFMLLMGQVKLHDASVATALGEECPFVAKAPATSELNYRQVDLGVLQLCGNAGHICVQDESSSIGGRCVLETRPAEETVSHHSEVGEVERILPTCEKCNGTRACLYADQSKIGCGSCIGDYTCYGFSGGSIGENSCNGDYACDYSEDLGSVGDGSCVGYFACRNAIGYVGDGSCNGDFACDRLQGPSTVGQNSCNGDYNCAMCFCPFIGDNKCNDSTRQCQYDSYCPSTKSPSVRPTRMPTATPTRSPSVRPSRTPTATPTRSPSVSPSRIPTATPTRSPSVSPSRMPTASPTRSPSKSPSKPTSPTTRPTTSPTTACFPRASRVKLQSLTGAHIQVFEVEVLSLGYNVAAGKIASQSTKYENKNKFSAGVAVDSNYATFSHTDSLDKAPWWMVDLGGMFPIESITIFNRWCKNSSDPTGCLCRLSHAAVVLLDDRNKWVYSTFVGNMCGLPVYGHNLTKSTDYCSAN